jgi:hypothetical protein
MPLIILILIIFYSNAVILLKDAQALCYDRETENGDFNMKQRIAENLSSKP